MRYCLRRLQALLSDAKYNLTTSLTSAVGFDAIEALPNSVTGDIYVCYSRDDHFLSEITSGTILKAVYNDGDPRLLGYACRRVFARNIDRYDLYCFIEDDHAILDPEFFDKVAHLLQTVRRGQAGSCPIGSSLRACARWLGKPTSTTAPSLGCRSTRPRQPSGHSRSATGGGQSSSPSLAARFPAATF